MQSYAGDVSIFIVHKTRCVFMCVLVSVVRVGLCKVTQVVCIVYAI